MLERIARLCVGVGLVWVTVVVFVGLAEGLDQPSRWFLLLDHVVSAETRGGVYLGLALLVVPIGMLTYLRDVMTDPLPLWMRAAAPGAFASVYALFLAAALPVVGQPLLLVAEPAAAYLVPATALARGPDATWSWLVRFGAAFCVLAGIPGLLGAVAGLLAGTGSAARR